MCVDEKVIIALEVEVSAKIEQKKDSTSVNDGKIPKAEVRENVSKAMKKYAPVQRTYEEFTVVNRREQENIYNDRK